MRGRTVAGAPVLLVVLAWGALAEPAGAQETPALRSGDRVRVRAPAWLPGPVTGHVKSMKRDTLRVERRGTRGEPGDRVTLSRAELQGIERSLGSRGHPVTGMLIGAPLGAAAGLVVWNAAKEPDDDAIFNAYLLGGGGAAGALLGLGTGALVRSERWELVPLAALDARAVVIGVSARPRP